VSTFERDIELTTDNPQAEILLVRGDFSIIKRGASPLRTRVATGLYSMKVKVGDEQSEILLAVNGGEGTHRLHLPAPSFETPIPLEGTSNSHEFQQGRTWNALNAARQTADTAASQILVSLRDPSPFMLGDEQTEGRIKQYGDVFARLSIRDQSGALLAEVDRNDPEVLHYGQAVMSVAAAPGGYFLTFRSGQDQIRLPLPAVKGWMFQAYVNLVSTSRNDMVPDLAGIAIFYDRVGQSANPMRHDLVATETVRKSLAYGKAFVPPETLTELYHGKFENPILGIYAAHYLLAQRSVSSTLKTVVANMSSLLGENFPDIVALRLASDEALSKADRADMLRNITGTPLLAKSWEILVSQAVELTREEVLKSPALRWASSYSPQGIFAAWRIRDRAASRQALIDREISSAPSPKFKAEITQVRGPSRIELESFGLPAAVGARIKATYSGLTRFGAKLGSSIFAPAGLKEKATEEERIADQIDAISNSENAAAALRSLAALYDWPAISQELRRNEEWINALTPLQRVLVSALREFHQDADARGSVDERYVDSLLQSCRVPLQSFAEDLQQLELGGWMSKSFDAESGGAGGGVQLSQDFGSALERFRSK